MKNRIAVVVLAAGAAVMSLHQPTQGENELAAVVPVSPKPANPPPDYLFDLTYVLHSSEGFELVEGTGVTLSFTDGPEATFREYDTDDVVAVWFRAGCNNAYGDVRVTATQLTSVNGFIVTEMGCPEGLHEQDQWLVDFLSSDPALHASGDHLTLTGPTATLSFLNKEVADPDRPLTGRLWTTNEYVDRYSRSGVPLDGSPTLRFDDDGRLRIFDSCNRFEGRYTVSGADLTVAGVRQLTALECAEEHTDRMAAHYARVFADGTLSFDIDVNTITLSRGEDGVVGFTE